MTPLPTLALMLILNSLMIFGIYEVTTYEEDEQGNITDKMALWFVRRWLLKHFGIFWSKPFVLCPPCMASVWGSVFYIIFVPKIFFCEYLIYLLILAGLNKLLSRYVL